MASFTGGFEVPHVDAREIRERLLADGHDDSGSLTSAGAPVIGACCVTSEGEGIVVAAA